MLRLLASTAARPRRHGRRHDGVDERRDERARRRHVDRPVEGDDAAERRQRVGVARAHVGVGAVAPVAAPHGLVCLITAAGRLGELEHDARGRVEIEEVGVRELLALQDGRGAERAARPARRTRRRAGAGSRRSAGRRPSAGDARAAGAGDCRRRA